MFLTVIYRVHVTKIPMKETNTHTHVYVHTFRGVCIYAVAIAFGTSRMDFCEQFWDMPADEFCCWRCFCTPALHYNWCTSCWNKQTHTYTKHTFAYRHTGIHTLTYLYAYTHSSNNKNNCTLCTHLIILVNIIAASYSVAQG